MNANAIPGELRELDRWVACRSGCLPVSHSGRPAYCCDRRGWCSFDQALGICREQELDGVAFALTADDPYVVVAFHDVIDTATGTPGPKAAQVIRGLASYAEVSYDRTGVRVILKGRVPVGTSSLINGSTEVYDRFRFVYLSGDRLPGTPAAVEGRQEELLKMWQWLFRGKPEVAPEGGLTDEEVVERAAKANKNFAGLWSGNASGYESESEAELALLRHLAYWTHRDPARMEALFKRSGLSKRPKWGRPSYREPTLRAALTGGVRKAAAPLPAGDEVADEQATAMARELAAELKEADRPTWRAAFDLAQRLRELGGDPLRFRRAADAFCEVLGLEATDFWYGFLDCWGKVEHAEQECVLGRAARLAEREPVEVAPCPGPEYRKAASLAYYLAKLSPDGTFFLAGETLGKFVGLSQRSGSSLLSLLQRNGFIECVDGEYSYTKRKSKSYRLR